MEKYTLEEVAKKSTETAGYIVIDKRVYEITDYMSKHPGGNDILAEVLGQDATEAFHEVGHSEKAKELLKPMLVGELQASTAQATKPGAARKMSSSYVWLVSIFGIGLLFIFAVPL